MGLSVEEVAHLMHFCREITSTEVLDVDFEVTKEEWCVYYRRLKGIGESAANREFKKLDENDKGVLTVEEICAYYELDGVAVTNEAQVQKEMDDVRVLEALQGRIVLQNRVRREKLVGWRRSRQLREERMAKNAHVLGQAAQEEENEAPAVE